MVTATVVALAIIAWGALFLIAPVWSLQAKPVPYHLPEMVTDMSREFTQTSSPIDINSATAEALDTLPGLGPVKAAAIVEYRELHGKFSSWKDLEQVDGISAAMIEKWKGLAVLGTALTDTK